jgi:hypothetical protein
VIIAIAHMNTCRYNLAKEKDIPLFRTLQWSWFAVAVFYTYGDFLHEFVLEVMLLSSLILHEVDFTTDMAYVYCFA